MSKQYLAALLTLCAISVTACKHPSEATAPHQLPAKMSWIR